MQTSIIVHGGAGAWRLDSERLAEGEAACMTAVEQGQAVLAAGGSALDAVEAAVCIVGVSTGGTRQKMAGRVGDSPLVGSGGYADNHSAAVSATGHGEALMKLVISKQVCDYVPLGMPAQLACQSAIALLQNRLNGAGGLIAIDHNGQIGFAFNTTAMPYAYVSGDGPIISGH